MCEQEGCMREINRDGLCLPHKLRTVRMSTAHLTAERNGEDVTQGRGTRAYVEEFTRRRRAAGLPDMEPENSKAARYMPKTRPSQHKKLKELNNGL